MASPNQKTITMVEKNWNYSKDNKIPFVAVDQNLYYETMKKLGYKTPEFAVWVYLAAIKQGTVWEFSPEAMSNLTGIPTRSIQNGVKVLIEQKYLVQKLEGKTKYDFYASGFKEEKIEVTSVEDGGVSSGFNF